MQDLIRDFLKDDEKLLKNYEKAEAQYILSLKDNYVFEEFEVDLDQKQLKKFIRLLAKQNLCLDEWVLFQLKDWIITNEMEKNDEKVSKHSKSRKN